MIEWVYKRALKSTLLDELVVAVDDRRVQQCVEGFGGKTVMTGRFHPSGTDRIAEAVEDKDVDIVVNIQGDHPLIDPGMIDEAVGPLLKNDKINMTTLKTALSPELYDDFNNVKVVVDRQGFALYFSRSLIPFSRDNNAITVYEHVGLYVYRKAFLQILTRLPEGHLEKIEKLEQLRVLENGYRIFVVETTCKNAAGKSVDTEKDLKLVERYIKSNNITLDIL